MKHIKTKLPFEGANECNIFRGIPIKTITRLVIDMSRNENYKYFSGGLYLFNITLN